jgi:hypothetical protein
MWFGDEGGEQMEMSRGEKELLHRIADNPYTGGGFRRAAWIGKVCPTDADRTLLDELCRKGLVETGLGGTVAGDTYRACWLTPQGKTAIGEE